MFAYLRYNILKSISLETVSQLLTSVSPSQSRKGNKTVWQGRAEYDGKNHSTTI